MCCFNLPKRRNNHLDSLKTLSDKEIILSQDKCKPSYFYRLISLLLKPLVYCQLNTIDRDTIFVLEELLSIMKPHMELFGLKIRCLLEMVKLLRVRLSLRNSFGTIKQLRSSIYVRITESSLHICFKRTRRLDSGHNMIHS